MEDENMEMEVLIESKVKTALEENNEQFLKNIGSMISKISSTSSVSNVCTSEKPKLKRKSNEEQFKHNSKVMAKLEEVSSFISAENNEKARESIIEAKDPIKRRQKLIQLADASDLGWKVVAEYETNPIASDSEDEKRIYKAEARASRKARSEKAKKPKSRPSPYQYRRPAMASESQAASGISRYAQNASNSGQRRTGVCFICGNSGHWKVECPQNKHPNNKISFSSV